MNQILFNYKRYKSFYRIIFFISSFIICFFIIYITIKFFLFYKYMNLSNILSYNYNTFKLYSESNYIYKNNNNGVSDNIIKCRIDIPIINISYPVFSNLSDDNLKISPCLFFGELPPNHRNLCIAGHNYDNGNFFSLIYKLKNNDKIYIYDNLDREFCYLVFDNYEVKNNDMSPIYFYDKSSYTLTLVTCNNFNNNRVIVKARLVNYMK